MKNITELILIFIEQLDYRDKTSPHTVVAYSCDLYQTFEKYLPGPPAGPKIDGSPEYYYKGVKETKQIRECSLEKKNLESIIRLHLRHISHMENSSRSRKVATLRKFFSFLKSEKIIDDIPRLLVSPKVTPKIPHYVSVDETLAILQLFKKPTVLQKEIKAHTLFLLLYGTGLRVSEACHLRWSAIDVDRRELRILGKGKKERLISMPTLVQTHLALLNNNKTHLFVWGEKPLNTRTAYNYIVQIGQKAKLNQPIHPHALRHSYATHLMNAGADIRIIQELLGHSSLTSTEKYTHVSMDHLARTMESFHPLAKKIS